LQLEISLRNAPGALWTNRHVYTSMITHKYSETSRSDKFIPFQFRDKHHPQHPPRSSNFSVIQPSFQKPWPRTDPETSSITLKHDNRKPVRKATTLRDLECVPDTPKLRETNSTKCQSPKGGSALQRCKVEEFRRIRLLGRGKFGDVYLVKYFLADAGTGGRDSWRP
jgi:hypothetical protein